MILFDFNGNGKIDPMDIAISIAVSEKEENDEEQCRVCRSGKGTYTFKQNFLSAKN